MDNTYIGQVPTANIFLTDLAPTFTSIETTWNICNDETGTCDGLYEESLDVSRSLVGWSTELNIDSIFMPDQSARPAGSMYKDYYQLSIKAVDTNGDDYKTISGVKWNILEELPAPADMDDAMLSSYIDNLAEEIEELEAQQADEAILNEQYKEDIAQILVDKRAQYDVACDDPRANCPVEGMQSGDASDEESDDTNWMLILSIVGGVIFVALAIGLMMTRRGGDTKLYETEVAWTQNTLPIHDTVANSMYGGRAYLPTAATTGRSTATSPSATTSRSTAPVAQPVIAGPPLPPGGLPAGWSMEQWQYYGQQYLDTLQR